jgi:hypothetical protein
MEIVPSIIHTLFVVYLYSLTLLYVEHWDQHGRYLFVGCLLPRKQLLDDSPQSYVRMIHTPMLPTSRYYMGQESSRKARIPVTACTV